MLLTMAAFCIAAAPPQTPRLEGLMREKLRSAQDALAAVVTSDWPRLERDARYLVAVTEDTEWMVLKTPEYARGSAGFATAAQQLAEAAAARDLEAAGPAYAALTARCVDCHRYVSRARLAR
jgi:hypothetical protein